MKKLLLLFFLLFTAAFAQNGIFISEYFEGASNNKAFEIYNGHSSGVAVNLTRLRLKLYANGTSTATSTFTLSVAEDGSTNTIAWNSTFVIYHSSFTTPNTNLPNAPTSRRISSGAIANYNGDDALELQYDSDGTGNWVTVDVFGQIGFDPGTAWGSGNTSTLDNGIIRKSTISTGRLNGAFTPSTEFQGRSTSADPNVPVTTLGLHTCDANGIPSAPVATSATNILQTSFTANWTSVSLATTYLLDVSKVSDFSSFVSGYNGKDIGNVTNTSVTGIGADSIYYYRVRASNASGTSSNSNSILVNTLSNVPASPIASSPTSLLETGFTANWDASSGATKYFLDVSTENDFSRFITGYENKDVGAVTTADISGLAGGFNYYYRVRAFNLGGISASSNVIAALTIPAAPVASAQTNNLQTSFTANWNASISATKYLLDVSTVNDFSSYLTGFQNADLGIATTANISGLAPNTNYYYRVRALNGSGTSSNSNVISLTTLPNAPDSPVATDATTLSTSGFTANWIATSGATKYFLDVSTLYDFSSYVTNYENRDVDNVTTFSVSSLAANTQYFYRVRAFNIGGVSSSSNVIGVTTNPGVPGTPVTTNATNITNVSFSANWNAVGGVSKYLLDVSTLIDFSTFVDGYNGKDVGNVTMFAISGLNASTQYYYRVRASNISGASDNSNVISVTTNPLAPITPVAASATSITQTSFTANWSASANATKYFLDVSSVNDFSTYVTGFENVELGNMLNANVTGLTAGTAYYYKVRASNVTGTSASSNTINTVTVPSAPVAIAATNNTQISFTANWNTVTGATKYFLDVSTHSDFSTFVSGYDSVDVGNVLSIGVVGLTANTNFHYRVRAVNSSGLSANSNVIDITTLPIAPTAPVAASATSITTTGFTANWNSSAGAAKYFLDISTQNDFSTFVTGFQNKDVANVTTYTVSGLTAGTSYHYRVRAFNIGGTSANSNSINATTSTSTTQTLTAGDIAIIGINTDDADQFSFVTFVDLQAGTVIRFTDSGVKADGTFRGSEGAVKYTTPSGGISAGTIIIFTSPASGNFSNDNDATVGTNLIALSTSGDQIIAFQGISTNPTYLYAITTFRNTFAADAGSSNETALPTGLTNGTTAVAVGSASSDNDNAIYNMSVTNGTKNELLAAISNNSNWTVSGTYLSMPTGLFTIGSGSVTTPNPLVAQNAINITTSGFTAKWNSSSGATKYFLDVATDSNFISKLANYDNKDAGNSTTATVTGLIPNTKYFYRIRAYNTSGTSGNSNIISLITLSNQTYVQFSTASGSVNESAGTFNLVFTITNPDPTNATTFQVALTGGTGSASDINNYITQNVTFPADSSANQTINLTVVNDAVAEGNETVIFSIQNISGGNNAVIGTHYVFTLTISDPTTGYYSSVNTTLSGSSFKTELHNLIKGHTPYPYTSSSTDVWDILSHAYQDPSNTSNVILIYTGRSQAKTYNASTNSSDPNAWNREHVWAQSRGNFNVDNFSHNPGVASDAHNLAPEDASVNSDRGNKDFDIGGTAHSEAIGSFMDSDSFEPRDAVKGDVARILFYMDVRYEGTNGEVQLELMDGVNTPVGTIGKLSTLLLWHQQDPPDAFEINRNNVIYSYQQNKNPFIDHPEWVSKIYGANSSPTITNITRSVKVPAENENTSITANIFDDGSVSSAQIIYSINNGAEQSINMNLTSGTLYSGLMPESAYVDGNLVTYKIKAVDNLNNERVSESYRVFAGTTSISSLHQTDVNGAIVYNGVYARIRGVATVPNGLFSSSNLEVNLQDASGGIVVYKVTAGSTSFIEGKIYTVVGSLTQYNGLAELIPDNAATDIIDCGVGTAVQPIVRTFSQLSANPESYEGMLIKVQNVNKNSGVWANSQNLTVNDGTSSAITVRISGGTNLAANPEPTWPKDIVGVFTQFDSSSPFTEGYQLKPRSISDFQDVTPKITAIKYIVTSNNYNPIVGNSVNITAQLADASNNAVATAGKVVNWSSTNGGSFSSSTSVTNASGIATVSFTPSTSSEIVHIVSVTDNTAPTPLAGATFGITTQSGIAVKFVVFAENNIPEVNSTINVNAQMVDAYNNLVKISGSDVIFTSSNGGKFEKPTVLTNSVGRAEARFTVPKQAGIVCTITASHNALLTGTSAAITSKAASPSAYKIIPSSYQPTAGSNIIVTSQLIDEFENPIEQSGKVITWSVNNGGVFTSQSTTNDAEGKSNVQLTVSKNSGVEHFVEVIDNSLTPLKGKSSAIKTISGLEAKYMVTLSNNKPFSGTTITITAQLVDVNNNLVQKAGKVISWSSTGGGNFSSPTSTTDNTGKAQVEFTVSVVSSTIHIVSATDAGSITGVSESFLTNAIDTPKLVSPINNSFHIPLLQTLNWLATTTAESYELSLSTDINFINNVQVFSNMKFVSKEVANLQKSKTYFWKVRAKKGLAFSNYSEIWSFKTVPNLPAKPILNLPITNSKNIRINTVITWQNVEEADNYILQLAEDIDFTKVVENKTTEQLYSVKGLKNSQNYFWRVKSTNFSGESDYSDVWTFTTIDTIYAPSDLTASSDNNFNINLQWKDNSNNEIEFALERLDEGNLIFYQFDKVTANTTQYVNTNLEQGKKYTFRIKALNDNTSSPYSNLLTIVVPSATINSPSNVKTTVNSNGHVIITWNDNSNDEIGFIVYRAEFANISGKNLFSTVNTGFVIIDTIQANTNIFLDNTTSHGKTYKYQVVTLTKHGVSIPAAAPNPIKPLVAPANMKAILDVNNAKLTWLDKSNDETGFIILRASKPLMNFIKIDSTLANVNTFRDNNVYDGRKFHYKVFAYDKAFGVSGASNSDSVYINMKTPTNLKVVQQLNKNQINLSWTDNSSSESGFIIERKENGLANFSEIGTVLSNIVSYSDATVVNKKNYTYRIKGYNEDGNSSYSTESSLLVGVERENEKPVNFALEQNYPNPFNPSTTINYSLPERAFVKLRIFDLLGKEVAILINAVQESGSYKYLFKATNFSSGSYFYILEAGKFRDVKKLILVK